MTVCVWNAQVCFTLLLWRFKTQGRGGENVSADKMRKRKDFFSHFVFPHWVTQFHGPLAYLRWRAVKSVQFWDFRGTVFLNLLRYVATLLPSPLDRLHHYMTVARVKQWKRMFLALVNWCLNKTNKQITTVSATGINLFCTFLMLKAQIYKVRLYEWLSGGKNRFSWYYRSVYS